MKKILGLDLGVASIGWGLIKTDGDTGHIADTGVRIFQSNQQRADSAPGESANADRTAKRSVRRQHDRRGRRKIKLYNYLKQQGMAPSKNKWAEWTALNPYQIRVKAIDGKVPLQELGRAFYHLNQRRGYSSNRKTGDEKDGVVKKGISKVRDRMNELGARTYGEYCFKIFDNHRNAEESPHNFDWRIRDKYTHRSMFKEEFETLWAAQEKHHPEILTQDVKNELTGIIFSQRPLKPQSKFIGKCPLETDKKRIAKGHLLFQEFRVLKNLNNLTLFDENGISIKLSDEDKAALRVELERKEKMTFNQLKRVLINRGSIGNSNAVFNLERGDRKYLEGNRTNHALANENAFGQQWYEQKDKMKAHIVDVLLHVSKPDVVKELALNKWNRTEEQANYLANRVQLEKGYAGFSEKAIKKLMPWLEKGFEESTAIEKAGYKLFKQKTGNKNQLPMPPDIKNPVVKHALVELRKVVNAIIRKHGMPDVFRVELARDLKAGYEHRQKMNSRMRKLEKKNEKARAALKKAPFDVLYPGYDDIIWYNLWEECDYTCPYTGKSIPAEAFNSGEFQLEHIIPFSRSLDNSFMNKTLCEADFNRKKGNRTPWECVQAGLMDEDEMLQNIRNLPWQKRNKFTQKQVDTDQFLSRQLNDTRYISREASTYLKELKCESVEVVKGQSTSLLRHLWGLNSILNLTDEDMKNRDDHRHHAVDAIVVALTSRGTLQRLSRENSAIGSKEWMDEEENSRERYGELKKRISQRITLKTPWENFRSEVEYKVNEIVVSHRVQRKIKGALHEDTYYGPTKEKASGRKKMMVVRKPVHLLSKKELGLIRDERIREIVNAGVQKRVDEGKSLSDAIKALESAPPYIISPKAEVPIQKVRLLVPKEPDKMHHFEDDEGRVYKHALYGNNHHIAIYEMTDKKGKKIQKGEVVTAMEAARRVKDGEAIVMKNHPSYERFLFSLSINDMVISNDGELFRVQKISSEGQVTFRLHDVALKGQSDPGVLRKNPIAMNVIKIKVSPSGEIFHQAND
ncbi:MAG: type II CRISPR RNA-guided endonuclease Cas9 [Balneolaceae bacterium]